jgi:hypothetical protein
MKTSEAFPSRYLKADDIQRDTPVTIESVEMEEVGQGDDQESKPVIHFKELEKGLVLNVTNSMVIEEMYGDETDEWRGRRIVLYATRVQFGKKMVMAIRVRERQSDTNAPSRQTDAAAELQTQQRIAWTEFAAKHPGKTKTELTPLWLDAIKTYFGRPGNTLGANEWKAFHTNKFVKPDVPDPIADEPPTFDPDSIPF